MGKLTTHVLDTMHGKPASDVAIKVFRVENEVRTQVAASETNSDGRVTQPLLEGDALTAGVYEIQFHVGEYFARKGVNLPEPRFVDVVVLRFGISTPSEHYHVPLVVTPWTYSTYRGS
ncbi:hydroxyisourate hydrolase [Crenobacter cavernae]|uniref:5-hydroxyisourate hydrolase n=1 Tax=Crenobacter cavernae TaxID=2290923 RepID=A0ABY0FGG3_9NEIS|nr:hydroxyisourate hydrolase [Crenobacter cavernae]RXZ45477.1 hydroxyisourate hydrolase [Crenobacter cavernae]